MSLRDLRDLLWPKPMPKPPGPDLPPAPVPEPEPEPPPPPPDVPKPPPPPIEDTYPEYAVALLQLHNADRKRPLRLSPELMRAALAHATWMAENGELDHYLPRGSSPSVRALAAGYSNGGVAENIGWNAQTALAVYQMWRGSPDHWQNLSNPAYTECGFGVVARANGPYWCAVFGRPSGA